MFQTTQIPATFFVDVWIGGILHPMREMVRFEPSSGLSFNSGFSHKYSFLSQRRSAFVDRRSSRWLFFFDSVSFGSTRGSLPVR